ncbi:Gamma-glutamyl phosphate reductase [Waddlia chondrophila 2032/99]|uniref:Gamma-glutamyl phosphate reductase n=2 Tax=Waddlia chondrophila TaxID=71667 RepID=D6YRV7_WADCW|nr:glutamate-5-semialdehyde dehydrogenase [Waddlia chondrophila]ADI38802.1 Gamma-glutamyl phosphate reductase [Waddlia chondrophila WSU 86-1044]CCB90989.1 Gamma-glutamyl phosphate reductase [Waddlia chondrophila 2032/99]
MAALEFLGRQAKEASKSLFKASTEQKNRALESIATLLLEREESVAEANRKDLNEAKEKGLDDAMLDRLSLEERVQGLSEDIRKVAALKDPVGEAIETRTLENGLKLTKRRTPIGVIGVIYESRPNVTADVASLCLKAGSCSILRGGSETIRTNRILVSLIKEALMKSDLPSDAVQLIDSPDRSLVLDLLKMRDCIDMIIPRGGGGLHQFCLEHSTIPVITGGIGICHLYVDQSADLIKALEVIHNAKTQRPTVCNALDTLLVHEGIAQTFIPQVIKKLDTVAFKLDPRAQSIVKSPQAQPAKESDWETEWLSLTLGIKVVPDLSAAISHIQKHSSGHSDGILTADRQHADQFIQEVDSAAVYVNASTRFTDGSQFGLGAEVAISTQKLHARGPMGLEELTTYKWIVEGNYQTRD